MKFNDNGNVIIKFYDIIPSPVWRTCFTPCMLALFAFSPVWGFVSFLPSFLPRAGWHVAATATTTSTQTATATTTSTQTSFFLSGSEGVLGGWVWRPQRGRRGRGHRVRLHELHHQQGTRGRGGDRAEAQGDRGGRARVCL